MLAWLLGSGRPAMTTFGYKLTAAAGRPAGFDYMRLILACGVFLPHAFSISYGAASFVWWNSSPLRPFTAILMPMFFSLSGFLVCGSLDRCRSLVGFLGLRVMRIFPALIAEVLISAFILGTIFTVLPLHKYFSSALFFKYFLNMLGHPQYILPGVFEKNPQPETVNAQLWTVPYELYCYLTISLLAVAGLTRRGRTLAVAMAIISVIYVAQGILRHSRTATELYGDTVSGPVLIFSFLAGVTLFKCRQRIPTSPWIAAAAAIVCWLLLLKPWGTMLVPLPAAYLTIYLGLLNPRRWALLSTGDYSYGIYLFGFPIQQAIAALGPWSRHWYVSLSLGGALTIIAAATSWHLLEKRVLGQRQILVAIEDRYLRFRSGIGRRTAPAVETT